MKNQITFLFNDGQASEQGMDSRLPLRGRWWCLEGKREGDIPCAGHSVESRKAFAVRGLS